MVRGLPAGPLALRREAEGLQYFGVQLDQDRLVETTHAHALRPVHVALVPVPHVLVRRRQLVVIDAIVVGIFFPLPGVRLALQELIAILAAPPGPGAQPRPRSAR